MTNKTIDKEDELFYKAWDSEQVQEMFRDDNPYCLDDDYSDKFNDWFVDNIKEIKTILDNI